MRKKIFITGASGFIGSNLLDFFVRRGHQVIGCTKSVNHQRAGNIYTIDLSVDKLTDVLKMEQPDFLIHCAGSASVAESFLHPSKDFINNVVVTENVLEAIAHGSPATKTLFLSSAAVYGAPTDLPITENTPTKPISPYGFHKLACELLCRKYHQIYGIPITLLRIFSAYGPGLKKQLLWDIYQKSTINETLTLFGTGNETRDFIYIDDIVDIINQLLDKSIFNANVFNIASGNETTVRQTAELMLKKLSITKPIQFLGNSKQGDPSNWSVNIHSIKEKIAKNFLAVETGIEHYVHWLQLQGLNQ